MGPDHSSRDSREGSLDGDLGGGRNPIWKRKNKILAPNGGPLNLIFGVNVSIGEVGEMADLALVGKI